MRYKKIRLPSGEYLLDSMSKPKTLTTLEMMEDTVPFWEIEKALRFPIKKRYFRLFLLHEDETIKEDVTQYVKLTGSLKKMYNQGQTRILDITFFNPDRIWNPSAIKGRLWTNSKFLLQLGVEIPSMGIIYYVDEGVFVCNNPTVDTTAPDNEVQVNLYDKFALLDGTINGVFDVDVQIPRNTLIEKAINMLLREPRDVFNNPFDGKQIIFPTRYKLEKTTHTIKKTAENTIGDILIDLANIISCDIFYDENGHLTVREGNMDIDNLTKNVAWNYRGAVGSISSYFPPFVRKNYKQGEKVSRGDFTYTAKRDLFALPKNQHFYKADIPENPKNGDRIYSLSANRNYEYNVLSVGTLYDVSNDVKIGSFLKTEKLTPMLNNYSNVYYSEPLGNLVFHSNGLYTTDRGVNGTYQFLNDFKDIFFDGITYNIEFFEKSFSFNGIEFTAKLNHPAQVYIVQEKGFIQSTNKNDGWIEIGCSENFQNREWISEDVSAELQDVEFNSVKMTPSWDELISQVVVIGANSGMGFNYKGVAQNTNPKSMFNINSLFGKKTKIIFENQINGSALCLERARYELRKIMQRYLNITFNSMWIPHVAPNDLIRFTDPRLDIYNELLLVQELSIPLNPTEPMNVTATNVSELTF